MAANSTGADEHVRAEGPVVFSCIQCHQTIADSWNGALRAMHRELNAFTVATVARATVAVRQDVLETRPDGSSYHTMECTKCGKPLGKVFRTTSRQYDDVRDMYSLDADAVSIYQLGTGMVGESALPDAFTSGDSVAELNRIKAFAVALHERIARLESSKAGPSR